MVTVDDDALSCRKRRLVMLHVLGMRLLTRLLLLVCSLSLVSLLFLSRCGLNVETEVQLDPGTGKYSYHGSANVKPSAQSDPSLVHERDVSLNSSA
jgi:hypothetical protein